MVVQVEKIEIARARLMETEYSYVQREKDVEGVVVTVLNERFKNKLRPSEKASTPILLV